jgi:hypothetical protein
MIVIEMILIFFCLLGAVLSVSISLGCFWAGPLSKKICTACFKASHVDAEVCPHCKRDFPQLTETDWQENV